MTAYKRYEMKSMMDIPSSNNAQNAMDFLLMPPPNMQMNTPFLLSGARGRASQSIATPFLLGRDSFDQNMELDSDTPNWMKNASKPNVPARNGSNTNDRIVFSTNGHSSVANRSFNATKTTNRATSNNQLNVENGCETETLNAAKRDLFNVNGTALASAANSNGRENTFAATNGSDTTNNRFGGQQHISSDHEKLTNGASNGTFDKMNDFSSAKNHLNDRHRGSQQNHLKNSTGPEKAIAGRSVFSRLNFDSNNTHRINGKQKSDADDNDADLNGDGMHSDDDDDESDAANNGQKTSNDHASAVRLFETAPFSIIDGDHGANQRFGDSNQQPHSGIAILSITIDFTHCK